MFPVALTLVLAWGALAMGGSPSWAAAPVLVLAVTTGILGVLERRVGQSRAVPSCVPRTLLLALAAVVAAIGIQQVPLPDSVVSRLSPARSTADFERLLAVADRRDPELVPRRAAGEPKPLSIVPARTAIGLAGVAGLALLLVGATCGFSAVGLRQMARNIIILGVIVTFVGLYQFALQDKLIYGWYVPMGDGSSAPFVNRNHQAGWLVMVLAVTLGAFAGEVARGIRGAGSGWRDRVLWLSTKDANIAVLLLFAAAVITVGILTTRSRSGAAAMVVTFLLLVVWNGRKQATRVRRWTAATAFIGVAAVLLVLNGEGVARRIFDEGGAAGLDSRLDAWRDTVSIVGDFWLTGTGFNTYGAAMLHYRAFTKGRMYIEAHNDYLQLAAEGGLLVGIPVLIAAAMLVAEIRRRFRQGADDPRTYWLRVGAVTGMVAIALQSIGEFTLQMPGAAVMFATLLAMAIHHPLPRSSGRDPDDG